MKQQTRASLEYDKKKKQTRRERFLSEMDQAVPWARLLSVIEPHYPKSGGRVGQAKPLEAMLRMYLMQQWYGLSDPGTEDALYEIESMCRFAGLFRQTYCKLQLIPLRARSVNQGLASLRTLFSRWSS